MGTSYSPNIVKDGLVFQLDAANPRSYPGSGTTCNDLVGSNNGTISGATFDSSNFGVFNFDGIDDYIYITPSTFTTFDEVSVSMWVKVLSDAGSYRGFFSARNASGANDFTTGINIDMMNASSAAFNMLNVEGAGRIGFEVDQMTTSVDFGVWAHLGVTISTSTIEVYINNQQQNSRSRNNTAMGLQYIAIGCRYYSSSYRAFLNADISGIQVYNRALSAQEIKQNYNALKRRFI
tara:strand:+ start:137 stop:841 length:705 start_codon:yes stop_codon:yes gene_type:complete